MKLAIIGSRNFADLELAKLSFLSLFERSSITEIVSGGAKGADSVGAQIAADFSISLTVFLPD